MVVDINGNPIKKGQVVKVHQEEEVSTATVVSVFPDSPTVKQDGHWVDIDKGDGVQGMMSYVLEVIK